MKLVIELNTDNAAFADNPAREAERILLKFSSDGRLDELMDRRRTDSVNLIDLNGNRVGTAFVVVP